MNINENKIVIKICLLVVYVFVEFQVFHTCYVKDLVQSGVMFFLVLPHTIISSNSTLSRFFFYHVTMKFEMADEHIVKETFNSM